MIRTRSRADLLPARLMSLALAGALATGFVAGQLTPDITGIFTRQSARTLPATPSLRAADDYGIRHMQLGALTLQDDYATRHASAAPKASLTLRDDYANRH